MSGRLRLPGDPFHGTMRGCRERDPVAGRIYPVNPAAVARLNTMMAEQRERRRQRDERKRAAAAQHMRDLAARRRKARKGDDMPTGQPMMTEEQARALHARAVAGEEIQALASEAGYAHQNAMRAYWRRMGLPGVREARRAVLEAATAEPVAEATPANEPEKTAVSEPERPADAAFEDVMVEPAPDDEPRPEVPAASAASAGELANGQEHTYPETAVANNGDYDHLHVLDTFDRRLASLRSLADELSEKGVRVRVSGRITVELEF